jgi:L-alanine-DL-glutamate epimerase-like enolase superfamily enzyme
MKIKSVDAIPFELKLKEPFSVANETVDVGINVFIKVETDSGIIGWGCATPDSVTSETKESVMSAFNSSLKDFLIGKDPTRIHMLHDAIDEKLKDNPSLKAGINIALYDILGKEAEMPLFRLLGGYREKIETSVTIGLNPPDVMVQRAKEYISQGFTCLKVKRCCWP